MEVEVHKVVTYTLELDKEEMRALVNIFSEVKEELYSKLPEGRTSIAKETLMAEIGRVWNETGY